MSGLWFGSLCNYSLRSLGYKMQFHFFRKSMFLCCGNMKNAHLLRFMILHEIHSLTLLVHSWCGVVYLSHWQGRLLHPFSGNPAAWYSLLAQSGLTQVGVCVSLGGLHIQSSNVKLFPFHLWAVALSHCLPCSPETPYLPDQKLILFPAFFLHHPWPHDSLNIK